MAYECQNFKDGQVLTAKCLNRMEKGIEEACRGVKTVNGMAPNENGNVEIEGGGGGTATPGADGFSPVANVVQTDSGVVISITDKYGTTTATVTSGKDGADGEKGEKGDTGPAGEKGATGDKGDKGDAFTFADFTADQLALLKGDKGDKGDTGAKGDKGDQGIQGEKGDTGLQGPKGDTGETGAQGEPGKDGTPGKDGVSATHSWNGTTLTITSASGTSSANLKGEKGDKGDQGIQGVQGEPGAKGDKGDKGDTGATGPAGKTAYQYAQDGGYTGTEAEFAAKLASEIGNPLAGKKVSFLGDSICAGSSETHPGGYGKIIADRNGMVYENIARGGATVTAETYSRSTGNAKPWLCRMVDNMSADADYAIIEGGINDGWDETVKEKIGKISVGYNATLDDTTYYGAFESMLKQLVTKFQGKKIGYIAVPKIHSLYDSSQNAPNFYHIALECCAKWGVSVCDLNTITPPVEYLSDLGTVYTEDGTHPTYEGYIKYYCDPIEAWMRTLTTSGNVSTGGGSVAAHDKDAYAHSDIRALIAALQSGKLNSEGVTFKRAKLPLADGTILEIDVLTALDGTIVIPFVNQVPISIDTNKLVYDDDGWKGKTRLSASSGGVKADTSGASITGFIPVKKNDLVRMQITADVAVWDKTTLNSGWNIIAYYDSSFTWLGSLCPLQSGGQVYGICTASDQPTGSTANGGTVSFTVPSNDNIAYVRLSLSDENNSGISSLIVTVNEEIK